MQIYEFLHYDSNTKWAWHSIKHWVPENSLKCFPNNHISRGKLLLSSIDISDYCTEFTMARDVVMWLFNHIWTSGSLNSRGSYIAEPWIMDFLHWILAIIFFIMRGFSFIINYWWKGLQNVPSWITYFIFLHSLSCKPIVCTNPSLFALVFGLSSKESKQEKRN